MLELYCRLRLAVLPLGVPLLCLVAIGCADADPCAVTGGPCDILQASCQEQIFAQTACVRGDLETQPPPVSTFDRQELREYLLSASEEQAMEPFSAPNYWDRALKLLRFIPQEKSLIEQSVDNAADFIAAFYSSRTGQIVIVDNGDKMDETNASFVLSHEFAHALQDRSEGLAQNQLGWVTDTDSAMAMSSLVEGEAVLISNLTMARMLGAELDSIGWDSYYEDMLGTVYQDIASSPAPFLSSVQGLIYPVGGRYATDVYLEGDLASVRALYDDLPPSYIDWQNGYRPGESSLFQAVECLPPPPPEGYEVVQYDRLGPAGVSALWTAQLEPGTANAQWVQTHIDLSQDLRGDRIFVYAPIDGEDGPLMVGWRTRWADAAGAERFVRDQPGHAAVEGNEALLVLSEDPELLLDWPGLDSCGALTSDDAESQDVAMTAWGHMFH